MTRCCTFATPTASAARTAAGCSTSRLNEEEFAESLDPEVNARIAQYEMAYRMQMSVPELTDFSRIGRHARDVRPRRQHPGSFAANCRPAASEQGVRFVQLYMRGWDQHGNLPNEIGHDEAVDQPQAALQDLKRRGLLDETALGGRVRPDGLLPRSARPRQLRTRPPPALLLRVLAGGGSSPASRTGTDDYSYNIVENPGEVHDLHATMLNQLGLDHEKIVYRHQGRDYRLTDGRVVRDLIT